MAHDRQKQSKKMPKRRGKALRKGDASEGKPTMSADPFQSDTAADPQDGAAVIHPVTPEVLEAAAEKAARLAAGVAQHTVELAETAAATDASAEEAVAPTVSNTAQDFERVADAGETARSMAADAVETTSAALAQAVDAAAARAEETRVRAASTAEAGLSDGADAFGRYNALLVEVVRSNMAATGDLFAALVQAKSVPEAVAINVDHLHRRFDALTSQGRELADFAQTLTLDAMKSFTETGGRGR